MQSWIETQWDIAALARRQLFFVGGAPRSGTTWLQLILDAHPDISCKGEGLFLKHLAEPMGTVMAERARVLQGKNRELFSHTGGYKPATAEDIEFLVGSAILLSLARQAETPGHAVGEKTPENVFFFPRLKQLFPDAKFIAIAREPRDVLASAWHFFQARRHGQDAEAAKIAFIRMALPSMAEGMRCMMEFAARHPAECATVTYEQLHEAPAQGVGRLFRLLGVVDDPEVVNQCIIRNEFAATTGGRPRGAAKDGAFLRKGVVGDWRNTFTPAMSDLILETMVWGFPYFGWAEAGQPAGAVA
jgi:hypothetical protein